MGGKGGIVSFNYVKGSTRINVGTNLKFDVSGGLNGVEGKGGKGGLGGDAKKCGLWKHGTGDTGYSGLDGTEIKESPAEGNFTILEASSYKGEVLSQYKPKALNFGQGQTYKALIIACGDYPKLDQKKQLPMVIRQAERLKNILINKYTFEDKNIELITNPNKAEAIEIIQKTIANSKENDNLLIFFSGHGKYLERDGLGFWLTSDSEWDDKKDHTWLGNRKFIRDIRNRAPSKKLLGPDAS